jgi:pimeloyl-ACP methyl ester carboxylesterase
VSAVLRRLPALLAVLAFVLAACGQTTGSTPSPEAIETAESLSRDVTIDAPFSTTPVSGGAENDMPIVLHGRLFGHGPTGVILAHMRPADQTAWFPYATELAARGGFTVLTFDFRGYGESTGDKEFDHVDTDLAAAYDYMRDDLGISRIFLVGASMGGTASLIVGTRRDVAGVVSISSPSEFQTMDALAAVGSLDVPKLFVTSEDDVPAKRSLDEMLEEAPEPKQQQVYDGDAHGTDLLVSPHAADLQQRITAFVSAR